MPLARFLPVAMFTLAACAIVGCDSGPPVCEVSGTVSYDGKPIEKGAISFFPLDGKSATSGGTIADGVYKVTAPLGEMKVLINAPKVIGKRRLYENNPNSPTMDLYGEILPARYNEKSELKIDVKGRSMQHDFELKK